MTHTIVVGLSEFRVVNLVCLVYFYYMQTKHIFSAFLSYICGEKVYILSTIEKNLYKISELHIFRCSKDCCSRSALSKQVYYYSTFLPAFQNYSHRDKSGLKQFSLRGSQGMTIIIFCVHFYEQLLSSFLPHATVIITIMSVFFLVWSHMLKWKRRRSSSLSNK